MASSLTVDLMAQFFYFCVLITFLSLYKRPQDLGRKFMLNIFTWLSWFIYGLIWLSDICYIDPFSAGTYRYCPDGGLFAYQYEIGLFFIFFSFGYLVMSIGDHFVDVQRIAEGGKKDAV